MTAVALLLAALAAPAADADTKDAKKASAPARVSQSSGVPRPYFSSMS